MADEDPDEGPDWDLLPDRPREFFALADGFDRKDLKRAYNRWLRRFKPERFPEEFQRIRAAYEQLDELLRYGVDEDFESFHVDPGPAAPSTGPAADPLPTRRTFPVLERLQSAPAAQVLGEFDGHPDKGAEEWIQRALLADELAPDDPLALYRSLVEGIWATEGHQIVVNFLIDACREPLPLEAAEQLTLELCELVVRADRPQGLSPVWYHVATESLWCQLITGLDFADFRAHFERCLRAAGDHQGGSYLVLTYRLMRRGLFRADEPWIAERLGELESRYEELSPWLQEDFDAFLWLDRYRAVREDFVAQHPFRVHVDEAVRAILEGDEVAADRAFFRLHSEVIDRPRELQAAFPPGESSEPAIAPLAWWADQVQDRYMRSTGGASMREDAERVEDFLRVEEARADHAAYSTFNGFAAIFRFVAWFVVGAGPVLVAWFSPVSSPLWRWVLASTVLIAMGVVWRYFGRRIDRLFWAPSRWLDRRYYRNHLRPQTLRFLESTHISADVLLRCTMATDCDAVLVRGMLLEELPYDSALVLSVLAHQFAE